MSDLLIKGMELPKDGRVSLIAVFSDGDVKYIDRETFLSFRLPQKAIEVPTHGRLIDVDKLLKEHPRISPKYPSETFYENLEIFNMLSDAPTVIEAST